MDQFYAALWTYFAPPLTALEAGELKDFLVDKLGRHEMPKFVEFRDELPKTMIGKLSKKELVAKEAAASESASG